MEQACLSTPDLREPPPPSTRIMSCHARSCMLACASEIKAGWCTRTPGHSGRNFELEKVVNLKGLNLRKVEFAKGGAFMFSKPALQFDPSKNDLKPDAFSNTLVVKWSNGQMVKWSNGQMVK